MLSSFSSRGSILITKWRYTSLLHFKGFSISHRTLRLGRTVKYAISAISVISFFLSLIIKISVWMLIFGGGGSWMDSSWKGGKRRDKYATYLRYSSSRLLQCMNGLIDSIWLTDRDKMVALTRNCTIETSCSLLPHKFNDLTDDKESHFDFSRTFSSVKALDIPILVYMFYRIREGTVRKS